MALKVRDKTKEAILYLLSLYFYFCATGFLNLRAGVKGHKTHYANREGQNGGKGDTIHCCNSATANQLTDHGLIPITADLQNLLSQCNDVTVPAIGLAVPIKNQCSQQAVCCDKID